MKTDEAVRHLRMYEMMALIRQYEETIYYLFLEGIMPGTIHQYQGQEACAVGMLFDLRTTDYMTSTHRPAGHALAKGVSVESCLAEMFAKASGCCRGKGGSMHLGDMAVGAVPAIAIVGGGLPIAVGIGLSCKMRRTNNVVVCFFGEGAANEGAFHEALNGAAIWDLPVIFACENNLYAASTPIRDMLKVAHVADRACAYGMPGEVVDGNDVLAVNEAAQRAIARARQGGGPTLLELETYRMVGHSRSDACGYRSREEEGYWKSRDPIIRLREHLLANGEADERHLETIEGMVIERIERALTEARNARDPRPEDALKDVYFEGVNRTWQ
ncbi:MAG TPA: thiamine pyrophosphate-dependent dehydrogenase E1 component subunit alpha [Atribacteraceae bacterium]|nr:thiamine pyrophosphate-dependent dehydrogenase E1 component subunit alpha [Atribacteraceae bacterium]